MGRAGTAPDYSPAAEDHRDQQAAEDAIPLPDFDSYRRFRRQSAPAQAIGRQRAGHAVCARKTFSDLNASEHPEVPTGAYTGVCLAAWISSNFASATYVESRNELEVAYDSNRLILNDQELRAQFPGSGSYPQGATPSRPLSINHLLGPSFINEAGNQQVFTFVQMMPYSEIYLRCGSLANAADTVGPLGHDIIAKIICKQGVGYIMESDTHENHMVNLRGPITLRYLRFKLTDYEGNVVNL